MALTDSLVAQGVDRPAIYEEVRGPDSSCFAVRIRRSDTLTFMRFVRVH